MIKLEEKIDGFEDYSRRNNIRIDGVEDAPSETNELLQVKVTKLFEEKLQIKNVSIDSIHRLAANKRHPTAPRTIITRLSNFRTRDDIMRNKSKLKGTGIYFNEDLSENTNKARNEKIEEFKRARSLGKIAYFKGRNLVIRDRHIATGSSRNNTPPRPVSELVEVFTPITQVDRERGQDKNLNHNNDSVRDRLRSNNS